MNILVLNAGSSSLRFSLYGENTGNVSLLAEGTKEKLNASGSQGHEHASSARAIIEKLQQSGHSIEAIGCRVVHGGARFFVPTRIGASELAEIRALSELAPLHNPIDADVIEVCTAMLPTIPVVAVFDTAFHHGLPRVAAEYALPKELSERFKLRRYGFHGIAHQFVSERLQICLSDTGQAGRYVICHLGSGASVCAIKNGRSIDTSMGFTPMEGLIMGTRCGDLDPGLLLYLIQQGGLSPKTLNEMLNYQSGLLGISGLSADMRELQAAAEQKDENADAALDSFAYRVSKYVGSYIAALEGVDAVAFSGGIGENSALIRARICNKLRCFGIHLDEDKNLRSASPAACISSADSPVSAWVIHADENLQIAKFTLAAMTVLT